MPESNDREARAEARRVLRKRLIEQRLAMSPGLHASLSGRINANLQTNFPELAEKRVTFYWPMKNEPDLRPLLRQWFQRGQPGFMALLPVVEERGQPLVFKTWIPDTPLSADALGLPAPDENTATITPEVLLIPVNAFDKAGYRLGYGGGFFDRTLARLAPSSLSIGVGFELSRVDSIDPNPNDMRLDAVVTEANIYRFGGSTP
jgi:5,10-methenyltetrahydrofolate synthetase